MTRKKLIEVVDLDGTVIATVSTEAIEFSVDGVEYVIDLEAANAREFRTALNRYTSCEGRRSQAEVDAALPPAAAVKPTRFRAKARP